MLKIERAERTLTVISDDQNAENAVLGDAIQEAVPELLGSFNGTPVVDGELRWEVDQKDWLSLLDVIDVATQDPGVDGGEIGDAYDAVDAACREAGLYDKES